MSMCGSRSLFAGLTILAALTFAGAAAPAGAENVVRMGKVDGMPTWDPQGAEGDDSFDGYRQVYESLVMVNA